MLSELKAEVVLADEELDHDIEVWTPEQPDEYRHMSSGEIVYIHKHVMYVQKHYGEDAFYDNASLCTCEKRGDGCIAVFVIK